VKGRIALDPHSLFSPALVEKPDFLVDYEAGVSALEEDKNAARRRFPWNQAFPNRRPEPILLARGRQRVPLALHRLQWNGEPKSINFDLREKAGGRILEETLYRPPAGAKGAHLGNSLHRQIIRAPQEL